MRALTRLVGWLFAALVRLYQLAISPLIPSSCNYYPTCSEYTRQAILSHGPIKGTAMGIMRIGRCSSRHWGGDDPVPSHVDFGALRAEYRARSVRLHPHGIESPGSDPEDTVTDPEDT